MKTRCLLLLLALCAAASATSLYNRSDTKGWNGAGFTANGEALSGNNGAFFTDATYDNFSLRVEYRTTPGATGSLLVRADAKDTPGVNCPAIAITDRSALSTIALDPQYQTGALNGKLAPAAFPARKAGAWNYIAVVALGKQLRVAINDVTVLETTMPDGTRDKGAIGLVTKGKIDFRNLNIATLAADAKMPSSPEAANKALPGDNVPPAGFTALFNGRDLTGWKGLVADPPTRAKMTPDQLAAAQKNADQRMRDHWKVIDGVLAFDGHGDSLCTIKDYKDFEMLVSWKILDNGDSGIYLRGSPQVQIWDPNFWHIGSGGLYNNQKGAHDATSIADNPIDTWNDFRIKMIGDKVSVWLNGQKVVDNVVMENYWERNKPMYPVGQLELQNHGNFLWFKNVYVREITDPAKEK